ncbi:MAG TPA: hypothetical protein VHZ52_10690 [Acidobacteriaceae bacterium]|jgi:hypothetical protein|nr:hypothetical protein [Acidobacteriaceae bacterium]
MEDQGNVNSSSSMLAALLRAWSTTVRKGASETRKPKAITLGAYLLPKHMHHNRAEIQGGEQCGCLFCEQFFPRSEILRWVGEGTTAICPRCGTASVVGSGAGFELTPELLHRAHQMLFEGMGRRA